MPALFRLAYHFEMGNPTTPVDKEKANKLLKQAAASGHLPSSMRICSYEDLWLVWWLAAIGRISD